MAIHDNLFHIFYLYILFFKQMDDCQYKQPYRDEDCHDCTYFYLNRWVIVNTKIHMEMRTTTIVTINSLPNISNSSSEYVMIFYKTITSTIFSSCALVCLRDTMKQFCRYNCGKNISQCNMPLFNLNHTALYLYWLYTCAL